MKRAYFLFPLILSGCMAPLSQTPDTQISQLSLEDICEAGAWNDEEVLAEQIANKRSMSCNPAQQMCYEAGLKPSSPKWSDCYIQAKGVIAQQEAAMAARASAAAAMQANIQSQINATTPRSCYGTGNAVTCY